MNVFPTTSVYVFPSPDPGCVRDKIIWNLIDGSASCGITEAGNFVMPAVYAVVHMTFRPIGQKPNNTKNVRRDSRRT